MKSAVCLQFFYLFFFSVMLAAQSASKTVKLPSEPPSFENSEFSGTKKNSWNQLFVYKNSRFFTFFAVESLKGPKKLAMTISRKIIPLDDQLEQDLLQAAQVTEFFVKLEISWNWKFHEFWPFLGWSSQTFKQYSSKRFKYDFNSFKVIANVVTRS